MYLNLSPDLWSFQPLFLSFFLFLFYIYLFLRDRERQSTSRGGAERDTQNPKQVPGSELSAQSPMQVSNPWTVRSWPELKSDAQLTETPRHPIAIISLNNLSAPFLPLFFSGIPIMHRLLLLMVSYNSYGIFSLFCIFFSFWSSGRMISNNLSSYSLTISSALLNWLLNFSIEFFNSITIFSTLGFLFCVCVCVCVLSLCLLNFFCSCIYFLILCSCISLFFYGSLNFIKRIILNSL